MLHPTDPRIRRVSPGLRSYGSQGLSCDAEGVFIGAHCALIQKVGSGYVRLGTSELELVLNACYGDGSGANLLAAKLENIRIALDGGDLARGKILTMLIGLPNISDGKALSRLNQVWRLIKAGFDPDQPRDSRGRWTDDGADVSSQVQPAAYVPATGPVTPEDQQRFIIKHLAAATRVAKKLSVPVENILGLSALESEWGFGPFVLHGTNNYFSVHCFAMNRPPKYATGCAMSGKDGPMAVFPSYEASLRSWAETYGHIVRGISDPGQFAAALQKRGGYGIKDGKEVESFVRGVRRTILGVRRKLRRLEI